MGSVKTKAQVKKYTNKMFLHMTLRIIPKLWLNRYKNKKKNQNRVDAQKTYVLMVSGPCELLRKFENKIHRGG